MIIVMLMFENTVSKTITTKMNVLINNDFFSYQRYIAIMLIYIIMIILYCSIIVSIKYIICNQYCPFLVSQVHMII